MQRSGHRNRAWAAAIVRHRCFLSRWLGRQRCCGVHVGLCLGSLLLRTTRRGALLLLFLLLRGGLVLIFGREADQHVSQCHITALSELRGCAALAERTRAGRLADWTSVRPRLVLVAQQLAKVDSKAILDTGCAPAMEAGLVALNVQRLLLPTVVARAAARVGGAAIRLALLREEPLVLCLQGVMLAALSLPLAADTYAAVGAGAALGAARTAVGPRGRADR